MMILGVLNPQGLFDGFYEFGHVISQEREESSSIALEKKFHC